MFRSERQITHAEALDAAQRLINSHFGNEGKRPDIRIPVDLERDTDVVLVSYIRQQADAEGVQI